MLGTLPNALEMKEGRSERLLPLPVSVPSLESWCGLSSHISRQIKMKVVLSQY